MAPEQPFAEDFEPSRLEKPVLAASLCLVLTLAGLFLLVLLVRALF